MPYEAEIYKSGLHTSLFIFSSSQIAYAFFLIIPSLPYIFSNMCFVPLSKFIVTLNLHKLCTGEKASVVSKAYAIGCLFSGLRLLINVFILWKFIFFGGSQ